MIFYYTTKLGVTVFFLIFLWAIPFFAAELVVIMTGWGRQGLE